MWPVVVVPTAQSNSHIQSNSGFPDSLTLRKILTTTTTTLSTLAPNKLRHHAPPVHVHVHVHAALSSVPVQSSSSPNRRRRARPRPPARLPKLGPRAQVALSLSLLQATRVPYRIVTSPSPYLTSQYAQVEKCAMSKKCVRIPTESRGRHWLPIHSKSQGRRALAPFVSLASQPWAWGMASFLPPSFRLCLCGLCFLTWVHTAEASLILETQLPLCLSSTPDDTHRHDANGPSTIFCSVVSVSDQPTTATANCNYAKVAVRGRSVSQSAPPPTDPWRLICLACLLARTLGHGGHYCELVTYAVSQLPRKYSHVYVCDAEAPALSVLTER
ncbi:hypothetical protein IWX50DRAFT_376307 [Phyllosticta citricarpa]